MVLETLPRDWREPCSALLHIYEMSMAEAMNISISVLEIFL